MSAHIKSEPFITKHKRSSKDFIRVRILSFQVITVLLMAKGMKSYQLALNEFIPKLKRPQRTVSAAAYSRARHKLKHTAFIELNQEVVVRTMYEQGDHKTYKGLRILAVDGSKIQLPTNKETVQEFGSFAYSNKDPAVTGTHSYALASVLYDVLNRVSIDATLAQSHAYEVELAAGHLQLTLEDDLVVYDRGYGSFRMMALTSQTQGNFLIRCNKRSFKVANDMLKGKGPDDVICEVNASQKFLLNPKNKELPKKLTVRFVRVILKNGGYEVLATSLLDQQTFTPADFKELYWLRWGVETFYGILKTRLGLENFSGLSVESIRQDFFASVLLTGIETIFTEDAERRLEERTGGHPLKVNKAVSFNAIKYRAFELFYSEAPTATVLKDLTELFTYSPTPIRADRSPPRSRSSSHQKLQFWKRKRKSVF